MLCVINAETMLRLFVLICFLLEGCTIPAKVFFRNFSNEEVRLQVTLVDRRRFTKLPNAVNFYDTATRKGKYWCNWKSSNLVTWVDTTTFYIDVPAFTVVDVEDISRGLVLGARQPDVMLRMITECKVDTLTNGDYYSLAAKFKSTGYGPFKPPIYYYDFR